MPQPAPRIRQLELRFDRTRTGEVTRLPSDRPFVVTSALQRDRARARVEAALRYALTFFPELDGHPFGVGVTRQALGLACLEDFAIWLNPRGLVLQTIAHELTHLLQARGLVPGGERACDLFSLARHPSLNDARPNYLDVPDRLFDEKDRTRTGWARVLFASARQAITERESGRRTYIRWFEQQLTTLADATPLAAG